MNQLEGKTILVTGASGFIGSHLVSRLSKISGAKLLLLSRQDYQSTQNKVWIKVGLSQLSPKFWSTFGIDHINYVFHLGAFTPKTTTDAYSIDRVIDNNIVGTRTLLHSLPSKPDMFIYSSTLDVYAQPEKDEVLTERSKVSPSTLYGASKLFCESLISVWAAERGCNYSILRYGHIYGPGEVQYEKLIPMTIRNLLAGQAPVIYGDGSALRDYLYVSDAVEATIRAALAEGNIKPVNIVRGESVTLKEIVQLLIRLADSNKEIDFLFDKPNGSSLRFDNGLMVKLLGNWPMTALEEGLAAEVDSFRKIAHV